MNSLQLLCGVKCTLGALTELQLWIFFSFSPHQDSSNCQAQRQLGLQYMGVHLPSGHCWPLAFKLFVVQTVHHLDRTEKVLCCNVVENIIHSPWQGFHYTSALPPRYQLKVILDERINTLQNLRLQLTDAKMHVRQLSTSSWDTCNLQINKLGFVK